jgi:cytochrome c oxidase subunit 3
MKTLSNATQEEMELRERVNRSLLYIAIFSSVMLFAGLTSAYIVRQADGNWLQFTLPSMFWVSTGLILASSASVNWALIAAKKDQTKQISYALGLTLILGIGFCITQILGWRDLTNGGIYFAGKTANPSGSFLYILSGVHLAHIFSALIYCAVIFRKSLGNNYHSKNLAGVRHCGIFWHFLDGLWVYLFIFLLFMQ